MVTGSFLIIALILVLCCACQGRTVRRSRQSYEDKEDLDYMERNSENSLLKSGHSGSNDSSNTLDHPYRTTEESSLELSDIPSHSSKRSHHFASLDDDYPPPPIIYDHSPRVHRVSPARNYNAPTHHLSPVPILKSPKPVFTVRADTRDSVMSDDLPLPPPPPPHHFSESETEDETCVKGLSPKFKTFLDKTIAVQPQVAYPVKAPKPVVSRNYPSMALDDSQQNNERTGLITSDL